MLFNEVPFLDRFERAARAGFEAVEFLFPYDHPAAEIKARLRDNNLRLVLHNLPAGDWDRGERGIACIAGRVDEFRAGVDQAVSYAHELGVDRLNCLIGIAPRDADAAAIRRTVVTNLRHAADRLATEGLTLLIEPINPFDIPGFWLTRSAQAIELLDEIGASNALLQYDIYHAQRSEGEIAATLEKLLPRIGHVQLADNPGRHEPGTGELNWGFLFEHLDRIGYAGHVGCEYRPRGPTTEAGLGWLSLYTRPSLYT
jgi:hydroxypyruvate isomerase